MNRNNDKFPLSVAIITKNEEGNLPACLASVAFADDIIVVDSGSTDRTVEIAGDFGCRVFVEEWKGFGPQKNSAIQKSRHEWILILDADERVPEETKQKILTILKSHHSADAYCFQRKNFIHGKWIRHSDFWPDRQIRLVRKNRGCYHSAIHEKWTTGGVVENVDVPIEHYSFFSYSDMLNTLNEYSTIISGELLSSGRKANFLSPVYHGLGMFIKIYLLKMGFLDGFDGLVIAITKAGGSFFKYAKLLELQKKNKG